MGAKILEVGSAVLRSSIWEGVAHDWLGVNKRANFRGETKIDQIGVQGTGQMQVESLMQKM
jgi:hypothetical protein